MNGIVKFIIAIYLITGICTAFAAGPDLEILRKKVTSEMMSPGVIDEQIKNLLESIRPDGTWPDINYVDVSRTGFQHGVHLANITTLSRAYKKQGSQYRGSRKVRDAVHSALNYWLSNDFICDNWWWNQIGTPDQTFWNEQKGLSEIAVELPQGFYAGQSVTINLK